MDDSPRHPDELFAERLNALFEDRRRPDGERWENSQVGAAIGMSRQQVHNLRNPQGSSRSRGPTWETINALARFFQVDPNYFFRPPNEAARESNSEDELTTRLADLGVTHVAANTVGEDLAEMRETVLQVLEKIQDMESRMNGQGPPVRS